MKKTKTETLTIDVPCRPHAEGYQPEDLTDREALELTREVYGDQFTLTPDINAPELTNRSRRTAAIMGAMRSNDRLEELNAEEFRMIVRRRNAAAAVLYWSRCAMIYRQLNTVGVPGKTKEERMSALSERLERFTGRHYSKGLLYMMLRVPERMNAAEAYRLGEHGSCDSDLLKLAGIKDGIERHHQMFKYMSFVEETGKDFTYGEYKQIHAPVKEVTKADRICLIRQNARQLLKDLEIVFYGHKYAKSTLTALKRNIAKALELLK